MRWYTAAELLLLAEQERQNRIQWGWGNWSYHADNLTLEHREPRYQVDLERCVTSAEMLDWIFQVSGKSWATSEDVAYLIQAFADLLSPQRFMCSVGKERGPIDPRSVIERKNSLR